MGLRSYERMSTAAWVKQYKGFVNKRVKQSGAIAAAGGIPELGEFQLELLKSYGLKPHHTLLDYGCGGLRAGIHIIRYLDEDKYSGIDISENMIESAEAKIKEEGLKGKHAWISVIREGNPADLNLDKFDYVWMWSVLTHSPPNTVRDLLRWGGLFMVPNGKFYATYLSSGEPRTPDNRVFYYPPSMLKWWAMEVGLVAKTIPDFMQPRGQEMLEMVRA